jgi:hypothetical protein
MREPVSIVSNFLIFIPYFTITTCKIMSINFSMWCNFAFGTRFLSHTFFKINLH